MNPPPSARFHARLPVPATLPALGLALLARSAHAAEAAPPEAGFDWAAFLGPFHVVLLHFPIGLLAAAVLIEALLWWRPHPALRPASMLLLGGVLASGLAAAGTGWLRATEGGFEPATLDRHRALAFAMLGAVALTLALQAWSWRKTRMTPSAPPEGGLGQLAHRGALLASLGLVTAAGHFGGSLTHGSDFLTRNAPPALASWMVESSAAPRPAPSAQAFAEGPFKSRIQPMLQAKCYPCHGPEKHKGDYRLDLKESAFRGGDSGLPGIVPGDPMRSNALRLTLLPREHDDAMPPDGKTALTPEEILAFAHWIQSGAVWPEAAPAK